MKSGGGPARALLDCALFVRVLLVPALLVVGPLSGCADRTRGRAFDAGTGDGGDADSYVDANAVADGADATASSDGAGGDGHGDGRDGNNGDGNNGDRGSTDGQTDGGSGGSDGKRRVRAEDFTGTLALTSFAPSRSAAASALVRANGVLVAVNPDSDSLTVVDEGTSQALAEILVGDDPRTVAVTSDARFAVVVNRGDATVSVVDVQAERELFYFAVGPLPYGVALVGTKAYVTEQARGQLAVLDLATRAMAARIALGDSPAGIATCLAPRCTLSGGDSLLITHFYNGALTVVDRTRLAISATVSTGADTNLSQLVAVGPAGDRVYLPQTRFNADNPNRQFDTTVFPVVNVVQLAPSPAGPPRLLNAERITLDTADRPVAMPFALDWSADGQTLWVANAGSNDVSVIDLTTQLKKAHIPVGANPRGLVMSTDGRHAYVNETLDGTLAVIDTTTFAVTTRVTLTRIPLDAHTLLGKRLFHSASRTDLAKDQWMACATCHFDGSTDRRTWLSFPDGPRNTTALFNLADTLPLHWSGDLNEVEDVEATIRFIQAGTGLAPAAQIDTLGAPLADASPDLTALADFIRAIPAPPSPFVENTAAISRGRAAFGNLGCPTCHAPPRYTDRVSHDVGTGNPTVERNSHGRGTSFDTPSLRALWLTPPYLHDGSAATLEDVFTRGNEHDLSSRADTTTRADLITFLLSL